MTPERDRKLSKSLSYVLRHHPEGVGVRMDPAGWVLVEELLETAEFRKLSVSSAEIEYVVAKNAKKRFALSEDGNRIRAVQVHSVDVDLGLVAVRPPDTLFHGTAKRNVQAIMKIVLDPGSRNFVHLSSDIPTAHQVGSRHGSPVVLGISAAAAADAGQVFYCAENGVWLTNPLPPEFISPLEKK